MEQKVEELTNKQLGEALVWCRLLGISKKGMEKLQKEVLRRKSIKD